MGSLFKRVYDVRESRNLLAGSRYGMVEASEGEFSSIQLRPFPKMVSIAEAMWIGGWTHNKVRRDRVVVYYNHPKGHSNFLAAKYVVSAMGTSLRTCIACHRTLEEIARLKGCDAILAEVTNPRITDRIAKFWGYERHNLDAKGRHYIRRFYGEYPEHTDWIDSNKPLALPVVGSSISDQSQVLS